MKKILVLLFLSLLIFASCKQEQAIKIGLSIGPIHERWQRDKDFFVKKIENSGAKVFVKEALGNEEEQLKQVKMLLKADIQVLVIAPENSETASKMVELAHEKGVRVIAYDRIIKNCDLDYYVSFDNVKVGELQADFITRMLPKGKYAILGGSLDDNNSRLLNLGQMNILQPLIERGDITIVLNEYVPNWNENNAYKIIDNYLKEHKSGLDAIIAASDPLSDGAYMALEEHGLDGKVLLTGQDAELEACRRIARGKQTMTVYKMIETLATAAALTSINIAKGKDIPSTHVTVNNGQTMVPSLLLPSMYIVHRENIRMTVIADGYLEEKAIFE